MGDLISVIIPVYNCEKFLPGCLDSVLASDYRELEILIADDGSTDLSPKIIKEYAQTHDNIRYMTADHKGVGRARNTAILNASGEYLFFMDGDDEIHPGLLSLLYSGIKSSKKAMAVSDTLRFYDESYDELVKKAGPTGIKEESEAFCSTVVKEESGDSCPRFLIKNIEKIGRIGGFLISRELALTAKFDESLIAG
ncbi:MAG: glycosyltransferase, partial [Lachnospiraceae bacterium]|nr:glycosyltransferase [Lachnospiraceae bacterium]